MAKLTEKEKKELKEVANSIKLRNDLRKISENRHNPFIINGDIDLDRFLDFLTEYNCFINHQPKQFHKILCEKNKL